MVPLNPKITNAGLALFPNPTLPGFQVTLTHVAIGTAKYTPTGSETGLAAEVARFPIVAGGATPAPNQLQIAANLTDLDPLGNSANDQWIGEIGFFAGATLFAVWSRPDTPLFYKTSAFDIPIAYTMDISRLPSGSVTVAVDAGEAAMQSIIFAHENRADPHPQYLTPAEGDALFLTPAEGDALIAAHNAVADPHPQYLTPAEGDALFLTPSEGNAAYEGRFPSGTRMLFQQTAAPTGWTKVTTFNNAALRVVSGTAGSGGTVDFTTAFVSKTPAGSVSTSGTVGDTTLSEAQMPSHTHTLTNVDGADSAGGSGYLMSSSGTTGVGTVTPAATISNTGGGASHTHSFSASSSFTGTAIDFAVKYTDVIIASKD